MISRSRREVDGNMLSSFDRIHFTVTFVPMILLIRRDNRSGYISGLNSFLKMDHRSMAGCIAVPFCETAMFLFSFSLYINLIPRNIRRLFCRQHNHSRKRNEKTVDVTNSMFGCNNLHFYRIFLLISPGILTTLFFYNIYAVFSACTG